MGCLGLKRYLLLVTLIPLLLVSEARPAEKDDDPTVAGLGSTFCYEPLRGDSKTHLSETQGYHFTVSPTVAATVLVAVSITEMLLVPLVT